MPDTATIFGQTALVVYGNDADQLAIAHCHLNTNAEDVDGNSGWNSCRLAADRAPRSSSTSHQYSKQQSHIGDRRRLGYSIRPTSQRCTNNYGRHAVIRGGDGPDSYRQAQLAALLALVARSGESWGVDGDIRSAR